MRQTVRWTAVVCQMVALLLLVLPMAGAQDDVRVLSTATLDDLPLATAQAMSLPNSPIADDRGFVLGGIGSDLWRAPDDPAGEFWMVTDRGPNGQIEVGDDNRRTFPVPDFTPHILQVRVDGDAVDVIQAIGIVGESGQPVTGLSNLEGIDEAPYDYTAQEELALNASGLETEGLVRTAEGEFWLADEYSPSLLRVAADGTVLRRYVPAGLPLTGADYPVSNVLPEIYVLRKGNRGFEGLALSQDGSTLYAALQSPLANPDQDTGEASRAGRILAFDIVEERPIAEYLYWFEVGSEFDPNPDVTQDDMKLSGLVALDATTLLVLERTDDIAKLYTVDLAAATDILASSWDDPATSPTLEEMADPRREGLTPLPKALLVDLSALEGMPQKIEGVAVVDRTTVAVANDNDFDIGEFDEQGRNVGDGTKSEILLVHTPPIPGLTVGPSATPGLAVGTPVAEHDNSAPD